MEGERELTKDENRKLIDAIVEALPEDAKYNGVIIFITANTDNGLWVRKSSNLKREKADDVVNRYMQSKELFDTFGTPNQN